MSLPSFLALLDILFHGILINSPFNQQQSGPCLGYA